MCLKALSQFVHLYGRRSKDKLTLLHLLHLYSFIYTISCHRVHHYPSSHALVAIASRPSCWRRSLGGVGRQKNGLHEGPHRTQEAGGPKCCCCLSFGQNRGKYIMRTAKALQCTTRRSLSNELFRRKVSQVCPSPRKLPAQAPKLLPQEVRSRGLKEGTLGGPALSVPSLACVRACSAPPHPVSAAGKARPRATDPNTRSIEVESDGCEKGR